MSVIEETVALLVYITRAHSRATDLILSTPNRSRELERGLIWIGEYTVKTGEELVAHLRRELAGPT